MNQRDERSGSVFGAFFFVIAALIAFGVSFALFLMFPVITLVSGIALLSLAERRRHGRPQASVEVTPARPATAGENGVAPVEQLPAKTRVETGST